MKRGIPTRENPLFKTRPPSLETARLNQNFDTGSADTRPVQSLQEAILPLSALDAAACPILAIHMTASLSKS